MTIDSLGSATNSNFQSGPSINGTGRMDGNTGTALVPSDYKPGDNALDAFRHELLLSRRSAQHHAYINVISRDSTPGHFPAGTAIEVGDLLLSFGACPEHLDLKLDNSIETYYADLGDARTELEYFLAYHQVSLHGNGDLNTALYSAQRGLNRKHKGLHDAGKTRRRNAIFFVDLAEVDLLGDKGVDTSDRMISTGNLYVFGRGVAGVATSKGPAGMTMFVPMKGVYWVRDTQTKHAFKHTLMSILSEMFPTPYKPTVTTARSKNILIEAPEFRYAGLALTDAHMHASQGDTAVTVNHYSALTTQNGPFDVYIGDDLGWLFNIELHNILPDGNRYPRVALTYGVLQQIIVDRVAGGVVANNNERDAFRVRIVSDSLKFNAQHRQAVGTGAAAATAARLGALKAGSDSERSKYPRFVLVPLRHGSGIAKRSTIMDRQRRIGKAIGSCKGYGRLDWVNGASSEM